MPSGYTAKIYEGKPQTTKEFLTHIARGMGAYIMQRDESMDEPPKARQVPPWYQEWVDESVERIRELTSMSDEGKQAAFENAKAEAQKSYEDSVVQYEAMKARYDDAIAKVEALDWPTDEPGVVGEFFTGYKKFVMEQLNESREFDCHEPKMYFDYQNADEWYQKQLYQEQSSYERRLTSKKEEEDRATKQNAVHNALMAWLDKVPD